VLMNACYFLRPELVKMLMDAGADIHLKNAVSKIAADSATVHVWEGCVVDAEHAVLFLLNRTDRRRSCWHACADPRVLARCRW
jgi:hypothetical protein